VNYYEHHLGDYMRDTAHLSMLEEGAYRRLLDRYYATEKPLPGDIRECCKLARAQSKAERDAVAVVLKEFFAFGPEGYRQGRADKEIARFQDKQAKARASINVRWQRERQSNNERNTDVCTDVSTDERQKTYERSTDDIHRAPVPRHQTPDTNTVAELPKDPPTPRKRGQVSQFPPGFDRFWAAYPRHEAKAKAAQAFARIRPDEALLGVMLAAIQRQRDSEQWRRDGGVYIPHPTTWLNGRRWEDETPTAAQAEDWKQGVI